MHFTVIRADQVAFDAREQMSRIFAEGFTQWLGFFSKDKQTIARAFAHMFALNRFYVAVTEDRKVAGMAACSDANVPSVKLNPKELRKHLGLVKGTLAGLFLKKEFEATLADPSPVKGSIDFVGTAPEFRGQGAAMVIIRHIIEIRKIAQGIDGPLSDFSVLALTNNLLQASYQWDDNYSGYYHLQNVPRNGAEWLYPVPVQDHFNKVVSHDFNHQCSDNCQ